MKYIKNHIIKLFSFMLCCTVLLLSGCSGRQSADDTPEYVPPSDIGPFSIADGGMSFYFDIDDNYVYVYENRGSAEPYQLIYHEGLTDLTLAKGNFLFEDINFDGYGDFAVPSVNDGEGQYYFVCLWNDELREFEYAKEPSGIADLKVCSGYLEGRSAALSVKYYWRDGVLTEESLSDENAECALKYAKGVLQKDSLSVSFARYELVDGCFCRLYFVYSDGEMCAYIALNNDRSRVFYSDMTDVYSEIIHDGAAFTKSGSFTRMKYSGVVFTYSFEGMSSLSPSQLDYYGKIYEKIVNFEKVSYKSADAAAAMEAVFADYPELSCYFEYNISGTAVSGDCFYPWDREAQVDVSVLEEAASEYDAFFNKIVDDMPMGLEPYEKYVYLAQVVQIQPWEEYTLKIDFLIPAESRGESLAATFQLLCRKAEIYCTYDSDGNTVLIDGEKERVSLEAAFEYSPGSAEWTDAFFID